MNSKVLKSLETMKEKADQKIEDRVWKFDERSEKWQESEKGDAYVEKTSELEEFRDNLEMTIESLETYLGK